MLQRFLSLQRTRPHFHRLLFTMSNTQQPIGLVSVNTAPARARVVLGQVIANVKDRYTIVHAGNSESK
jgi:hypothetical protein